jgi:hypothetical protein
LGGDGVVHYNSLPDVNYAFGIAESKRAGQYQRIDAAVGCPAAQQPPMAGAACYAFGCACLRVTLSVQRQQLLLRGMGCMANPYKHTLSHLHLHMHTHDCPLTVLLLSHWLCVCREASCQEH